MKAWVCTPILKRQAAKTSIVRLLSRALLSLTCCIGSTAYSCGIDHVKARGSGLEVYFEPDTIFIFFSINQRGDEGAAKKYSVANGRLVTYTPTIQLHHGWHPFAPRHFFLDRSGSASSFNFFGGCSYDVKSDQNGLYLHVQGAEGDTSDMVYERDFRPGAG